MSHRLASSSPAGSVFNLSFAFGTLLLVFFFSSCKSKTAQQSEANQAPPNALELTFTYGSEKEKWISEVTAEFNRGDHRIGSGKRIFVRALPMGSGEAIDEVMEGRRQPHIVSPASAGLRHR
jgi:hypothetical protein